MMKRETIPIADVYVPIKRRATLERNRVDELAASILDKGLLAPILVSADGARCKNKVTVNYVIAQNSRRFGLALWFDHDEARDHPNRRRLRSDQASCAAGASCLLRACTG